MLVSVVVLFDGQMHVHYGHIYLHPADANLGFKEHFQGQRNGLLGAAVPQTLMMLTGLHTGMVPVVVEFLDVEPALQPDWEDVVEASFTAHVTEYALAVFEDWVEIDLPHAGDYRARYSAVNMDAADAADVRSDDEPEIDRYRLQLWLSPPAADTIVRQTSDIAAYWHGHAQSLPAPPSVEEKVAAEAAEAELNHRLAQEREAQQDLAHWDGQLPSDELRRRGQRRIRWR